MSTERFLYLCKECGITNEDMLEMDFGQILDYIDEYLEMKNPDNKGSNGTPTVRKANQNDFDSF